MKYIIDNRIDFGKQIITYITHFKLDRIDIANIFSISIERLDNIISGKTTLSFDNMVKLASFFGIKHYEFSDKNFPFPLVEKLPASTKEIIRLRKLKNKEKIVDTISSELDRLVKDGEANSPTTSKILFHKIKPSVTANKKSSEVTKLFNTSKRDNITSFNFKKKSPKVFIHIDFIDKFKDIPEEDIFEKINEIEKEIDRENETKTKK